MNGDRLQIWEAAKMLVAEANLESVPTLLELMRSSPSVERRVAAAWTLGFLGSSAALEPLARILADKSQPAVLRDHAAEALGYLSDPKARDVLVKNLFDEDADVAFSSAFALRTAGRPEDIPELEKLANTSFAVNSYGASVAQEAREAAAEIRERAEASEGG